MNKRRYKYSVPIDDFLIEQLQDKAIAKGFLKESFKTFTENGNMEEFLYSLEIVIKARQSLTSFCEEANINRSNLYDILKGKKKPQLTTILKILSKLGYTLKVA